MTRELANKMYTPTAYFLGRFLSQLMIQVWVPIIMMLIIFWAIDIDTSWENFGWTLSFAIVSNFCFNAQGYFVGLAVNDQGDQAKQVNLLISLLFLIVDGGLVNIGQANWFVKFLSDVTPSRFICEGFFRCFTKQVIPIKLGDQFVITQEVILE